MSDKCVTESYITGEKQEHKSLKEACKYLKVRYESVKDYFSRNKGARCWLSRDKTMKIEKI